MRRRHETINTAAAAHGTRARYVGQRCRCAACRRANRSYYHARMAARRAAAPSVTPSGPPLEGKLVRGGVEHQIRRCPGAEGKPCVRGGTWLRTALPCCNACIERATVWNGLVSAEPVRRHLLELRRIGVGRRSVAAAASVSHSTLSMILRGKITRLRAATSRRILSIDEGARAGGAVVSQRKRLRRLLGKLIERGFSRTAIAKLLGKKTPNLQLGQGTKVTFSSLVALERLWRRVERGELEPEPGLVDSDDTYFLLRQLVARGMTARSLSRRLGFAVKLSDQPKRVHHKNARAVRALVDELERADRAERRRRELDELASSRTS